MGKLTDETGHVVTRRRLIASGISAAIGSSIVGSIGVAPASAAAKPAPLTTGLKRARFSPYAGTKVTLVPDGAPAMSGQLVAVEDLAGAAVAHLAGSQDAYALRLRAPSTLPIAQDTLTVRHPRFGEVRLFVTPAASARRQRDYLAVVNRVLA